MTSFTSKPFNNLVKASGKGSGLDAVADEMGKRFARKSRKMQPEGATV
ncbi:hypothetical protein [Neosynechococcus sphagnicola]|nr:hypothetical protein [Neosynechococcus sphagnicola]